jgi:pSer/pThr/pTyr-binding forkhead associated (FHA) protein
VVTRGPQPGKEFVLDQAVMQVGRWDPDGGDFPEVDLTNDDSEAKISRRHARILNRDGQFFIEDTGSLNGTFVNRGTRLSPGEPHAVRDGDEIILGKTFFKFVGPGADAVNGNGHHA